jgi:hypothetical protein
MKARRSLFGLASFAASVFGATVIGVAVAAEPDAPLRPEDFALRVPLALDGPGGLHQLPIDAAVWNAARRADLRDLRVFNAQGESLPWGLLAPGSEGAMPATPAAVVDVPMVTLPAAAPARDRLLADVAVRVQRADGSALTVTMDGGAPAAQPSPATAADVGGYLFDLRGVPARTGVLMLRFAADAPDVADAVQLLGSDDMVAWRPVAGGPLVHDTRVSPPVEHGRFALRDAPAFVRLDLAAGGTAGGRAPGTPGPSGARLAGARFAAAAPLAPPWAELVLPTAPVADEPGALQVEIPPALPMRALVIRPAQADTVVRVRVYAYTMQGHAHRHRVGPLPLPLPRRAASPEWQWRAEGDVFRVQRGDTVIESPPLAVQAPGSALRIVPADGATAFGGGVPTVVALWQPTRLVFAARGQPPFTLAVGHDDPALAAPPTLDPRPLLAADDPAGVRLPVARVVVASAGPSGPAAVAVDAPRRAPADAAASSTNRWVLWGVLAAAVLVVGGMAIGVWRQMQAAPKAGGEPPAGPGAA